MILCVNVTQDDIERGLPTNPEKCPISLAICRAVENIADGNVCYRVMVGTEELTIRTRLYRYEGFLPLSARDFVSTYDSFYTRKNSRPFSFEIVISEESE